MYVEDLHILKPSASGPYTTIQAAIQQALVNVPPCCVFITPEYTGTDTYTNASNVPIIDLRPTALNTGSNIGKTVIGGVPSGIQATAAAAANITGAAAANVFVTTLNLPTSTPVNYSGVPFVVKAAGYLQATAGTYTATVQPLIYGSTISGFTASAAAALYSATAYNVTISSATTTKVPWQAEVHLEGDSTSALFNGWFTGAYNNGAPQIQAAAAIGTNGAANIAGATFTAAVPVQFLAGLTTVGATLGAGSIVALTSFFLEV
jgi:hypothetical protein